MTNADEETTDGFFRCKANMAAFVAQQMNLFYRGST